MQNQVLGEHSQMLDDEMWNAIGYEYDKEDDFNELLAKINSPDFFRPFSERLRVFYNEISQTSYTADEAATELRKCSEVKRSTINNWFSGKSEPNFGDSDRQRMFAVAFALKLDVVQTERLFHKVLLDKAFNKRNRNEFIYLYCIYNKKPLSVAEEIITSLSAAGKFVSFSDATVRTNFLSVAAMRDVGEDELLEYILTHPHNFSLNNTAALKRQEELLDRLTGRNGGKGLAQQEHDRFPRLADSKNKDKTSVDFTLSVIKGVDYTQKDNDEIIFVRDEFPQRKEIFNQFPDKQTLSKKDPSSYALRKGIIFLQFYSYWVTDLLRGQELGEYDGFVEELNDILFDCGFSPLYIGNPYDWLFLYCSSCHSPLDVFRGIITTD